jgi:hypothetical protein
MNFFIYFIDLAPPRKGYCVQNQWTLLTEFYYKNVSTFVCRILLCLTGYAAGVWSEVEKASRNFH